MATQEIAQGLVDLCRSGQYMEAIERYYGEDIVSVEWMGEQPEMRGLAAVRAKSEWFTENHTIHGQTVEGPYVNGDQFAVRFTIDITPKAGGQRTSLEEIAVYTVAGGKIVHERFFYGGGA